MRLTNMPVHAAILCLASASPCVAGGAPGYYGEAPSVTIYAPPPAYAPPPPPLVQFGGFLGAVATLPFTVIGGLFGAIAGVPAPATCVDPATGQLFPCPVAAVAPCGSSCAYAPPQGPVEPYYQPQVPYAPPDAPRPRAAFPERSGGHSGGSGPCYASDGTRLRNTGDCAPNPQPQPIPDTRGWGEPNG